MKDYKLVLSMLDSYKRGTMKIKRQNNPTLYDFKKTLIDVNEKNKGDSQYFRTLRNMTENYTVEMKYAQSEDQERRLLYNTTVSFTWIGQFIDEMHRHIYTLNNTINSKIEEYQEIAKNLNLDIEKDIDSIKKQVEIYKSTDVYNEFYKECERKKDVLDELSECIKKIERDSWNLSMKKEINFNTFIGQNYPTDFRKSPELSDLVIIINKAKEEFKNYFVENKDIVDLTAAFNLIDNTDEIFHKIHNQFREAGYTSCHADVFYDKQKDKSVLGFLKNKSEDETEDLSTQKIRQFKLPEWSNIQEILIFDDSSILIKNNKNEYKEIMSSKELIDIRNQLIGEYINEQFKKNPTIAKNFKQIKDINYVEHIDTLQKIMNKYKENESILKINDFDILNTFKKISSSESTNFYTYEKFDDAMSKIIRDHKIKQYIHSIASKKYEHLYNEDTYKIAGELYDLKLPDNSLQEYIGKKLAAFKNPEEFNNALRSFLKSLNDFEMNATINKAEKFGVQIISELDNKLIIKIDNFEQSNKMGSSSWCISRDESYFDSYAKGREQYFLFDFSKDNTDSSSMIGITLEKNGDYYTGHYKDDEECYEDNEDLIEYVKDEVYEFKNKLKESKTNAQKLTI